MKGHQKSQVPDIIVIVHVFVCGLVGGDAKFMIMEPFNVQYIKYSQCLQSTIHCLVLFCRSGFGAAQADAGQVHAREEASF